MTVTDTRVVVARERQSLADWLRQVRHEPKSRKFVRSYVARRKPHIRKQKGERRG